MFNLLSMPLINYIRLIFYAVVISYCFSAHANVVGSDIQNFNPTTSGLDFVTVQSSETLEPGIVNVGFFLNYAVNLMPNYEDTTTQARTEFQDTMLGMDLNIGLGIMRNWDVGLSVPQVLAQDSEDNNVVYSGEISQTGITEYRLNTKYRFFGDENHGLAAIYSMNIDQSEDNPFTGNNPGLTHNIELAWDNTYNRIAYGFNLGYRFRDPGKQIADVPVEPFDDQYIASAAVSYLLSQVDTKLIGEIYSSFPKDTPDRTSDRDVSTTEVLIGVKKDLRHDVAVHVGGGTELYHGSSSPDWRVYAGLNWNFGPIWSDKEQVDEPKRLDADNVEFNASTPVRPTERFVAGDVLFEFNSDELSPKFQEVLLRLAEYVKAPPALKSLTVVGHTDSVGPEAYNQELSERRAKSVRRFLVESGKLPADKVMAVGYGESKPIADNANFQGRQKNRRVEFNLVR